MVPGAREETRVNLYIFALEKYILLNSPISTINEVSTRPLLSKDRILSENKWFIVVKTSIHDNLMELKNMC